VVSFPLVDCALKCVEILLAVGVFFFNGIYTKRIIRHRYNEEAIDVVKDILFIRNI